MKSTLAEMIRGSAEDCLFAIDILRAKGIKWDRLYTILYNILNSNTYDIRKVEHSGMIYIYKLNDVPNKENISYWSTFLIYQYK